MFLVKFVMAQLNFQALRELKHLQVSLEGCAPVDITVNCTSKPLSKVSGSAFPSKAAKQPRGPWDLHCEDECSIRSEWMSDPTSILDKTVPGPPSLPWPSR